jgi:hypothetical protein
MTQTYQTQQESYSIQSFLVLHRSVACESDSYNSFSVSAKFDHISRKRTAYPT